MNVSIGARLREERERLGYNQKDFGGVANVTIQSQGNYESGRREPSAGYLSAIAQIGADVSYILTGTRTGAANQMLWTPEEVALVDNYRHCSTEGQSIIRGTASLAAQPKMKTGTGGKQG